MKFVVGVEIYIHEPHLKFKDFFSSSSPQKTTRPRYERSQPQMNDSLTYSPLRWILLLLRHHIEYHLVSHLVPSYLIVIVIQCCRLLLLFLAKQVSVVLV